MLPNRNKIIQELPSNRANSNGTVRHTLCKLEKCPPPYINPMNCILRSLKNLLLSTLLLLVTLLATGPHLSIGSIAALSPIALVIQETEYAHNWRKTRYGWEDSSKWVQAEPIPFERRIELIHPLAVSGIILLSSIGMLIWASEEWDTERLFSSGDTQYSSTKNG